MVKSVYKVRQVVVGFAEQEQVEVKRIALMIKRLIRVRRFDNIWVRRRNKPPGSIVRTSCSRNFENEGVYTPFPKEALTTVLVLERTDDLLKGMTEHASKCRSFICRQNSIALKNAGKAVFTEKHRCLPLSLRDATAVLLANSLVGSKNCNVATAAAFLRVLEVILPFLCD